MEIILGLMAKAPEWFVAIAGIVTSCTVLSALTPSKIDDKVFGVLGKGVNIGLKIVNMLAGNVLKNTNKDAK